MNTYELLFIVSPEVDKGNYVDAVRQMIRELQGEIVAEEDLGRRQLSYPIDHNTIGNYLLFHTRVMSEHVTQLTKELKIMDGVLRFMLTVSSDGR